MAKIARIRLPSGQTGRFEVDDSWEPTTENVDQLLTLVPAEEPVAPVEAAAPVEPTPEPIPWMDNQGNGVAAPLRDQGGLVGRVAQQPPPAAGPPPMAPQAAQPPPQPQIQPPQPVQQQPLAPPPPPPQNPQIVPELAQTPSITEALAPAREGLKGHKMILDETGTGVAIPPPREPEPERAPFMETIRQAGKYFADIPENTAAAFDYASGADFDVFAAHPAIEAAEALNEQRMAELLERGINPEQEAVFGVKIGEIQQGSQSSGFSLLSSGAGLAAGGATGIATKYPPAAIAAGTFASGTMAYKIAVGMFKNDVFRAYNQKSIEEGKGPITPEAWKEQWEDVYPVAVKSGLFEAIPEMASNAVMATAIFRPLTSLLGKSIITRLPAKWAGVLGAELGTETITEIGQEQAAHEAGLPNSEEMSFLSSQDWQKAFQRIYGPTLTTLALQGGSVAAATKAGSEVRKTLSGQGLPLSDERARADAAKGLVSGAIDTTRADQLATIIRDQEIDEGGMPPPPAGPYKNVRERLEAEGDELMGRVRTEVGEWQNLADRVTGRTPMKTPFEKPAEEEAYQPPLGPRSSQYVATVLQETPYERIEDVPDDELGDIAHKADQLFKDDIVRGFMEEDPEDPKALIRELEDAAFEIRNLEIEGQKRISRRGQTAPQSRMPGGKQTTATLIGSQAAESKEGGFRYEAPIKILKRSQTEGVAAFVEDVPEFGIKAGERVEFDPQTGAMTSGYGTGPYAASRSGSLIPPVSTQQVIRGQKAAFSKKAAGPPEQQSFLSEEDDYDTELDNQKWQVLDDIDQGYISIREGSRVLATSTGMPEDVWLEELLTEYPNVKTEEDINALQDYTTGNLFSEEEESYYGRYEEAEYEKSWVNEFYDKASKTYSDSSEGRYSGYTHWKRTPSWALDSHLATDAKDEVTEGTTKLVPGAERAISRPLLGGAKTLRRRLNRKHQKVAARALSNILNSGFPRGVVESINAYTEQLETKFLPVSAAYDGKRHEVRFARYVLDDMTKFRSEQGYQRGIRFLLTHELTHAMESDRREYTLSMQSPLFSIPDTAITRETKTEVIPVWDKKTGRLEDKEFNTHDTLIDYDQLGPVISEMIQAWESNLDLGSILSYPYASLSSVPNIKTERKRRAELNRIKAESFAQLGALYYTYPDLVKEHIPAGYKLFQEVTSAADQKSYSKRRLALRGPLQLEGAGRGDQDVRGELEGDAYRGRTGGETPARFNRRAGDGRDVAQFAKKNKTRKVTPEQRAENARRQAAKAEAKAAQEALVEKAKESIEENVLSDVLSEEMSVEDAADLVADEVGLPSTKVAALIREQLPSKSKGKVVIEEKSSYSRQNDESLADWIARVGIKYHQYIMSGERAGEKNLSVQTPALVRDGYTDENGSFGMVPAFWRSRDRAGVTEFSDLEFLVDVGINNDDMTTLKHREIGTPERKKQSGHSFAHLMDWHETGTRGQTDSGRFKFYTEQAALNHISEVVNNFTEAWQQSPNKIALVKRVKGKSSKVLILQARKASHNGRMVWKMTTGWVGEYDSTNRVPLHFDKERVGESNQAIPSTQRIGRYSRRSEQSNSPAPRTLEDTVPKSRSVVKPTITEKRLREVVDKMLAPWPGAPRYHVVEKWQDLAGVLPDVYQQILNDPDPVAGEVSTAFLHERTGEIYYIRQNYNERTTDDAELEVIKDTLHEIRGHYAIRAYFGPAVDPFLGAVYKAYEKEIKASNLNRAHKNTVYHFDLNTTEGQLDAADEWTARMAEPGKDPANLLDRFIGFIKQWLTEHGIKPSIVTRIGKRDVRYMLGRAAKETVDVRGSERFPGRGKFGARFSRVDRPFYSQLEAMMQSQAPPTGTPEQYLKWLDKATKGNEKLDVKVEDLTLWITDNYKFNDIMKKSAITDMMGKDNFNLPKKFINTYWQQTAPKEDTAQNYVEFLRNAERAATGGPIKEEEIGITGLRHYLKILSADQQKDKLSRTDLALWINANKLILSDVYGGTFKTNYNDLVEDVFGVSDEQERSPRESSAERRDIEEGDLDFSYSQTEDYDESEYDHYYSEYINENLEDRQDAAGEAIDRDDYIDRDAYNEAVGEEAQELADRWNESIEDEDDTRDAGDYEEVAESNIDESDYLDEDSYNEAVDEARDDAQSEVETEAQDHAREAADELANETHIDEVTGWHVQGNDNVGNWSIYDNDWDFVDDGWNDRDAAVTAVADELQSRGWYVEGTTIYDEDDNAISELTGNRDFSPPRADRFTPKWSQYTIGNTENYRELLLKVPLRFTPDGEYKYGTHFDASNYLVYARISDKAIDTEDGSKRILFIEELQADWPGNQAGMVGYSSENKVARDEAGKAQEDAGRNANEAARSLLASLTPAQRQRYEAGDSATRSFIERYDASTDPFITFPSTDIRDTVNSVFEPLTRKINGNATDVTREQQELLKTIDAAHVEAAKAKLKRMSHRVSVPDAPLKNSYQAVMIKRLARLAVDEGYDGISVSKGIDHSERRWGSNIFTWTNIKFGNLPEINKRRDALMISIANEETTLAEVRERARRKGGDILNRAIQETIRGEQETTFWQPNRELLDKLVLRMRADKVDIDGDVWTGDASWFRVANTENRRPDPQVMWTRVGDDEGGMAGVSRSILSAVRLEMDRSPNREGGPFYGIDLSDLISEEDVRQWRSAQDQGNRVSARDSALAYYGGNADLSAHSGSTLDSYKQKIQKIKNRLGRLNLDLVSVTEELRAAAEEAGKTLPEGQFYIYSSSDLRYSVTSQSLAGAGGKNSYEAIYKYPEDKDLAKILLEEGAISHENLLVDFNHPEDADTRLWEILRNALATQSIEGAEGGSSGAGEIYRTLPKFKQRILKSVDEDGKSYGMWARRAAGLNLVYDKTALGKQTGLRMLSPKVKTATLIGLPSKGEYSYVEIDDDFRRKWGRGQAQFSRKARPSGEPRQIMEKIGKEGALQKVLAAIRDPKGLLSNAKDTLIRKTLDGGVPLKRMVQQVAPEIPADEDPYVAWRMLSGDSPIIEDWLGLDPKTEGTVPYFIVDRLAKRWHPSLRQILEPVMQDKDTLLDFIEYVTARRAQELKSVGKENLYDDEDIRYGLSLRTPLMDATANRLYAYQDRLIGYAVEGGLLSPEVATRLRRYTNYIPFFRESEYEGDVGGKRSGVFKRIKGGRQNIRDPLQNIMENTANIIHATNRNAVLVKALKLAETRPEGGQWMQRVPMPKSATMLPTQRIIEQLEKQGVSMDMQAAEDIAIMQTFFQSKPIGDEKNRIIILKEEGKQVAVKIADKGLWDSLHAIAPMELGLLTDLLAMPAETVRTGIVLSPDFMVANLTRDTLSGFIQARKGINVTPFASSAKGMLQSATGAEIAKLYRSMGGGYADIWHGDSKEAHASLSRLAKIGGFRPGTVLNPATYWRLLRRIGTVTETGTRLNAFQKQLKKNPDDPANALLAALESREISVDFSLHGTSKTLRVLERITPFLNPAKQGLYKMGRTLGDQPLTALVRGTPLIVFSLYLWLLNRDEDWYKEIEDWEKNTYWHADIGLREKNGTPIPLRLPKPFEYGALFGSFQETLAQYLYDKNGEDAMLRVMSTIEDVFLLRGTPPALILPAELWSNKSTFTERPVVPRYLEQIDPRYQYGAGTSNLSRVVGSKVGLSPIKLDHSVRSVFGTLGVYALMAVDKPLEMAAGYPSRASKHWYQQPAIRRFFSGPFRGSSRSTTEFYDALNKMRTEQATWKFLDYDSTYLDSLDDKTSFAAEAFTDLATTMSVARKANRDIRDSKTLSPDEKRDMIDLNNMKIKEVARKGAAKFKGFKLKAKAK